MRALLYSHVFLSACAVALTAETAFVFDLWDERMVAYCLFVFCATIITYNIKGLLAILKDEKSEVEKINWARTHKEIFLAGYVSAFLVLIFLFFDTFLDLYFLFFPVGLLSVTYSFPFKIGKYHFSPRYFPFLKTVLVAMVWAYVVGFLPCYLSGISFAGFRYWIVAEFVFLFSLSVLFDIKDIEKDSAHGMKTFPRYVGIKATQLFSLLLMAVRVVLFFLVDAHPALKLESLVTFVYLIFVVNLITRESKERFYMSWIDGLMLVRLVVFLLVEFYIRVLW